MNHSIQAFREVYIGVLEHSHEYPDYLGQYDDGRCPGVIFSQVPVMTMQDTEALVALRVGLKFIVSYLLGIL